MEGVDKLNYTKEASAQPEFTHTVKQTISQGLNDGGVLSFRVPADPERFTDLNTILLRLELGVVKSDGTAFAAGNKVFLDAGGMHSLFSSCEVRFNDKVVSTMTLYPYTTAVSRYLGSSASVRDGIWDTLDGTWSIQNKKSDMTRQDAQLASTSKHARVQGNAVLIGRIYSDVLMSSRQYLPPGVTLGIDLRRAPEAFSLTSHEDIACKAKIQSASIYVQRTLLRNSNVPREGMNLTFNRLEARLMSIAEGSGVFRWLNCLNNGPLPNRIYIGFVAQSSLYGHIRQLSTYFENLNLSSLNMKLNGRDLLVEPIKVRFRRTAQNEVDDESDGTMGFLSIAEVLNQVGDQTTPLRLSYAYYMRGVTLYAIELNKCGEMGGGSGSLDLELFFGEGGAAMNGCVMLFTEVTETTSIT